jgi:hypothetical protein
MGIVYTDKIKPGMVVAEEVRDVNGRLLLARGNSIQPSHMRIFKIWARKNRRSDETHFQSC